MFAWWGNFRARCGNGADNRLKGWGWAPPQRDLFWHFWQLFKEQAAAVVPISVLQPRAWCPSPPGATCQLASAAVAAIMWVAGPTLLPSPHNLMILVLAIFFQQAPTDAGLQVMGLVLAIFGLMAFLEGLRVCIMPLAEQLGTELPQKLHVSLVLLIAFCLGVLVTYAEPAISALRPLASLVDPAEAPYLYYMMNQQQEILVLCIGLGVGVAAVIGTLRFIRDWPLKPLIYLTLAPTVGCACYMQWGHEHLSPLLGVAWDCGGVTTGPVTVPILLALGIGVMRSTRKKKLATAALHSSVAANAGQALEGFGIVTLASLFPVLAVELLGIVTSLLHSYDQILAAAQEHAAKAVSESAIDKSPLREVIFAIRSILPLVVALSLLIILVLRKPLPAVSWAVEPTGNDAASEADTDKDSSVHSRTALYRASVAVAAANKLDGGESEEASQHGGSRFGGEDDDSMAGMGGDEGRNDTAHGGDAAGTAGKVFSKASGMLGEDLEEGLEATAAGNGDNGGARDAAVASPLVAPPGLLKRLWVHYGSLITAVAVCQIGMIAFNVGLTYGFTALGNQTGSTLPASFLKVSYDPRSPYYSYAGGLILTLIVLFVLGVLATRAEPALNVLGRTVEKLSGGSFTAAMLIGAVCVGVGLGMVAGALKILYSLPLIYFLLVKYSIAVLLTVVTDDSITAVAWDSAGVTTGPVTVPFVLSIGIGFSKAVGSAEGFGMLTIMSVAPIISVLVFSHIRKPAKNARRHLSRAARSINRTIRRPAPGGGRQLKYSQSTAQAAFAADAGASTVTTPDSSFRDGNRLESISDLA